MKFVLAALLTLGLAAPASASVTYPDQKPAPYKTWDLVNGWARPFWGDRDVRACEGRTITVWQASDLTESDGDALGRGGDCELWLRADVVSTLRVASYVDKNASRKVRAVFRALLIDACTVVFHETGHALGLPHSTSGVMAADLVHPPTPLAWAPYECRLWVAAQFPR